jgi:hypothetical protein
LIRCERAPASFSDGDAVMRGRWSTAGDERGESSGGGGAALPGDLSASLLARLVRQHTHRLGQRAESIAYGTSSSGAISSAT